MLDVLTLRAKFVIDHSDPFVCPVKNFSQVPEGKWTFKDPRLSAVMYRVKLFIFPQKKFSCLLPTSSLAAAAEHEVKTGEWKTGIKTPQCFMMPLAQARGPVARLCSNPNPLPDGRRIHTGGAIHRTEWMECTGYMVGKYFHNDRIGWLSFKTLGQFSLLCPNRIRLWMPRR